LIAVPITIWSARRWIEKNACTSASEPPAKTANRSPTTQLPLHTVAQMPKKAPASIIPSSPMLMTPARSLKMPPIAANVSGVAKRRVAAIRPALKMSSSDAASFPWSQSAEIAHAAETAMAQIARRFASRLKAQSPAATPRNASASGTPAVSLVHGGSADQSASRPRAMPRIAIDRGSVSRRRRSFEKVASSVLRSVPPASGHAQARPRASSGNPRRR
jgi:hypothetical protein